MLRNMSSIYIFNGEKILMLYRIGSKVVKDCWCSIGGHFELDELNNPKKCMLRELYEETGIKENDIKNIKLKYITLRYKNNEIRQNYYFFANLKNYDIEFEPCNEGILKWININNLFNLEMPYTAEKVLNHYFSFGRYDDLIYSAIAEENKFDFIKLLEF